MHRGAGIYFEPDERAYATANLTFGQPLKEEEWGAGGGRPILILQPAEDALAPGGAQRLRDRFPDRVALLEIPGSGHAILPEQPARIEREILRYLASMEAPA